MTCYWMDGGFFFLHLFREDFFIKRQSREPDSRYECKQWWSRDRDNFLHVTEYDYEDKHVKKEENKYTTTQTKYKKQNKNGVR